MTAPSREEAYAAAQDALREGGAHGAWNTIDALTILGRALLAERARADAADRRGRAQYARGLAEGREQARGIAWLALHDGESIVQTSAFEDGAPKSSFQIALEQIAAEPWSAPGAGKEEGNA